MVPRNWYLHHTRNYLSIDNIDLGISFLLLLSPFNTPTHEVGWNLLSVLSSSNGRHCWFVHAEAWEVTYKLYDLDVSNELHMSFTERLTKSEGWIADAVK